MTYNIHPLFVHFPIALLVVYSFIKILPLGKLFPRFAWRQIGQIVLLVGVLGAFVASSTGEVAEHLVRPDHDLVEMHALFASLSTWVYGLILLGELIYIKHNYILVKIKNLKIKELLFKIEMLLTHKLASAVLAILGLVFITITGVLGGVMVYGLTADPIAPVVLKLLNLY